jgi:hypothetical protein
MIPLWKLEKSEKAKVLVVVSDVLGKPKEHGDKSRSHFIKQIEGE